MCATPTISRSYTPDVTPKEAWEIAMWTYSGASEDIMFGLYPVDDHRGFAYYVKKVWHWDDDTTSIGVTCWYDIPGLTLYAEYSMPDTYEAQYDQIFMDILKSVKLTPPRPSGTPPKEGNGGGVAHSPPWEGWRAAPGWSFLSLSRRR